MIDKKSLDEIDQDKFDELVNNVIEVLDEQRYDTAMQVLFASIDCLIGELPGKAKTQLIDDLDSFLRILRHHYGTQESHSKH